MIQPGSVAVATNPVPDAPTVIDIGIGEIIGWTVTIVVAAFLAYVVYRAMERPRLRLVGASGGLRALPRDVVLYAVSIPFLILTWILFFWVILLLADNQLDALGLIVLPASIVVAARVLAHLNSRVAHEVAKIVPLTIITLIILGGQIRDDASFNRIFEQLEPINVTWPALVFVLLVDYALTAGWYWIYVRWWAPSAAARRERRDDRPRTG